MTQCENGSYPNNAEDIATKIISTIIIDALKTQELTKKAIYQVIKNKIGFELSAEIIDYVIDELWFNGLIKSKFSQGTYKYSLN